MNVWGGHGLERGPSANLGVQGGRVGEGSFILQWRNVTLHGKRRLGSPDGSFGAV